MQSKNSIWLNCGSNAPAPAFAAAGRARFVNPPPKRAPKGIYWPAPQYITHYTRVLTKWFTSICYRFRTVLIINALTQLGVCMGVFMAGCTLINWLYNCYNYHCCIYNEYHVALTLINVNICCIHGPHLIPVYSGHTHHTNQL